VKTASGLRKYVEVLQRRSAVDPHVENAHSGAVINQLRKFQRYCVVAVRNREIVIDPAIPLLLIKALYRRARYC
jgi:hypothetical protein